MSHADDQSFDVRIWGTRRYTGKRGTTYNVRWRVAHRSHGHTLATKKLAESFHAELLTAHRKGESFGITSGLPRSMQPTAESLTWFEHACNFVDHKWPRVSARHRKGIAEALSQITAALTITERGKPAAAELRAALREWAFNTAARTGGGAPHADVPQKHAPSIQWMSAHSVPLQSLGNPAVVRTAMEVCSRKLDGSPAAPATTTRKRSALYSALEYAVESELLATNPMDRVKQPRAQHVTAVDRRVVVNPTQARALLGAVRDIDGSLEGFFACLYYAGLRPAEARHLRRADCTLPGSGWGQLLLAGSTQPAGTAWTDGGTVDEDRSLKHRSPRDVRTVPAHPELVATLRRHLEEFPASPDGRLFVTRVGIGGRPLPAPFTKPLPMSTVYRVWDLARRQALTPEQVASPLGKRPYDLRHACVSTWLNAGVDATQVASWAGHSVQVLLRVYAKCIFGQEEVNLRRIEAAVTQELDPS